MENHKTVEFEIIGNVAIATLKIQKILDEDIIIKIEQEIELALISHSTNMIILDFNQVQFLTSAFLGYLIRFQKKINESGGQLRLCGIEDKIEGIFKITRLDKIFDIHSDVEKALLSMGQVNEE